MRSANIEFQIGDCLEILPTLAENSIDSCVTDPPYHLTSIEDGARAIAEGRFTCCAASGEWIQHRAAPWCDKAHKVEREVEYAKDIERRIAMCMAGPVERVNAAMKAKQDGKPRDDGPLFSQTWDDMWSRPFDRPDLV